MQHQEMTSLTVILTLVLLNLSQRVNLVQPNLVQTKENQNFEENSIHTLASNCKDQFDLSFKILNIKSLNIPNWDTDNESTNAFVSINDVGCLETGYFMAENESVLEIPYLLSRCEHGGYKIQLVLKDLLGNIILKTFRPNKLNYWNIFSMELPKNDNQCVLYKVLLRTYTKNCMVVIKHLHILSRATKSRKSKESKTSRRPKREANAYGSSEEPSTSFVESASTYVSSTPTQSSEIPKVPTVSSLFENAVVNEIADNLEEAEEGEKEKLISTSETSPSFNTTTESIQSSELLSSSPFQNKGFTSSTKVEISTEGLISVPTINSTASLPKTIKSSLMEILFNAAINGSAKNLFAIKNIIKSGFHLINESNIPSRTTPLTVKNKTKLESSNVKVRVVSNSIMNKTLEVMNHDLKPSVVNGSAFLMRSITFALIISASIILVVIIFAYLAFLSFRKGSNCNKSRRSI